MTAERCPRCRKESQPPKGGGPYFCPYCHGLMDSGGPVKTPAPNPLDPGARPPEPERLGAPPQHVSRYGTNVSQTDVGPGHGFAAADSPVLGLLLAAVTGGLLAVALGWLAANHLRVPLVYSAIVGYGIRRALAAGSGGGTPDRGLLIAGGLLLIVVGTFGGSLYLDSRATASREGTHFRAIFGDGGFQAAEEALASLRDRDEDHDDSIHLVEDDTTISLAAERERLVRAAATGVEPDEPYDFYLLARTGRKGLAGYLAASTTAGQSLRFFPRQTGWPLGGVGTLAWWGLEFLVLALFAFTKVD